jgi:hypothetical protein
MVPLNITSKINSKTQHGLPTALSFNANKKLEKAEQRASEKAKNQERKAARNAKSHS